MHFSPILKITDPTGLSIAPFQEAIRAKYPIVRFEHDEAIQIEVNDGKVTPTLIKVPVWRFADSDDIWQVSLTRESIAVETRTGYTGRRDFVVRVQELLDCLIEHLAPAVFTRVGVRFVNSTSIESWKGLATKCPEEIRGLIDHAELKQGQMLWRLGTDEGELMLRTGMSPKGETHDPSVLDPSDQPVWYLDVDVFSVTNVPRDTARLTETVKALTERARMIFGWAIGVQ